MGYPVGIFSHPKAGRLRVTFGGRWRVNASDNVFSYGGLQLVLQAYVGEGAEMKYSLMSKEVNTVVLERAYAGGYLLVPVGIRFVEQSFGGVAGTISATGLYVTCALLKA